mmetsp:Transcript_38357/g.74380  ORF Transcript_38357/g.74380 Transcript_38357/m.74380 type:complete len:100 (-) Transcript_38357:314-613(-)
MERWLQCRGCQTGGIQKPEPPPVQLKYSVCDASTQQHAFTLTFLAAMLTCPSNRFTGNTFSGLAGSHQNWAHVDKYVIPCVKSMLEYGSMSTEELASFS